MTFSVAVWNMQQRASGWDYFDRVLDADIALLQEVAAAPPSSRPGLCKEIGGNRPWGSCVLSRHPLSELREVTNSYTRGAVPLIRHYPGAVVTALVEVPHEPIVAVSTYGLFDDGYSITSVHRILSDLTPLMDSSLRHQVLVGGDLNCSSQLPPPRDRARHRNLFDRFETLGLVDLTGLTAGSRSPLDGCPCEDEPCRHVQTFRRKGAAPYQDDWLFASERLALRARSVVVHNDPDSEAWSHSDHAPISAAFA